MRIASWLACPAPRPHADTALVCFPHAGAGTMAFAAWGRRLYPALELHIASLPGRGRRLREPAERNMETIVSALCAEIVRLRHQRVVFFGHSLGALVAYEVTRALRRKGAVRPSHLVVSSRGAPTVTDSRPPLHTLSDDAFIAGMSTRYGGIPAALLQNPELLAIFIPALRADMALHATYTHRPAPPLPVPITAWCGRDDPGVTAAALEGWRAETTASFTQRWFAGGHFYLQQQTATVLEGLAALRP